MKACGCSQGPDSITACFLQAKIKVFKSVTVLFVVFRANISRWDTSRKETGDKGSNYPMANAQQSVGFQMEEHLQTSHSRGGRHAQVLTGFKIWKNTLENR